MTAEKLKYSSPAKTLRAPDAARAELSGLTGEARRRQQDRVNELVAKAKVQNEAFQKTNPAAGGSQIVNSARSGTARSKGQASSPHEGAHHAPSRNSGKNNSWLGMIRCWPRNRWRGNLGKAEFSVITGRETRVPGMRNRLAEVFHLGNRHQTRRGSNRTLRRRNSSNNNSSSKGSTMWSTDMMMVTRLWKESGTCVTRVCMVRRWNPVWDHVS